jgi:Flp pilus assembly protein TadG
MKPNRILTLWRKLRASERGNLSVELALSTLFLLPMLTGLLHYGGLFHQTMQLRQAARAGVEYAMTYPSDTTGIEQAVTTSSAMSSTGIVVAVNQFCECPDGTSVSCTGTCASGGKISAFVDVIVTQPPNPIVQFFPLGSETLVRGRAVMRVN